MKQLTKIGLLSLVLAFFSLSPLVSAASYTNKLTPYVNCLSILDRDPESGFTWYYAHFGYVNSSNKTYTIPYGSNNTAQPWSVGSYGFPTTFEPGKHDNALVLSMTDHMEWKLGDQTAVATLDTPLCQ